MAIALHTMRPAHGAKKDKKRVARGLGSKGTTGGRGQKGQTSRAGSSGTARLGMRHIILATPKLRGFRSLAPKAFVVNVGALNGKFIAGEVVTPKTLAHKGLIPSDKLKVKILSKGELTVAVTVKNCSVSATAKAAIEKAGGKVEV